MLATVEAVRVLLAAFARFEAGRIGSGPFPPRASQASDERSSNMAFLVEVLKDEDLR